MHSCRIKSLLFSSLPSFNAPQPDIVKKKRVRKQCKLKATYGVSMFSGMVICITGKASMFFHQFKVDRPQTTVVAKNLSVLQLFISRMPKMCAILQLVSAPLNPIPIAKHFRRSHPQCEHSCEQHIYMSKENNAKQNEDVM